MEKSNLEEMRKNFENFDHEMEISLGNLIYFVEELKIPELLPLDYSWDSLDQLENLYSRILDNEIEIDIPEAILQTRLARYMGETLRKNLGGRWALCEKPNNLNFGLPGIIEINGISKNYMWSPFIPIRNYKRRRIKGLLKRSATTHLKWIKKE